MKHDDTADEHLDSLLRTIMSHEKETGKPIDADIVSWRGMMTKLMAAPFEDRDGYASYCCLFSYEPYQSKTDQGNGIVQL